MVLQEIAYIWIAIKYGDKTAALVCHLIDLMKILNSRACLHYSVEKKIEKFYFHELTFKGNRMGNQENIPGECVSGFIPASVKKDI